MKFYKLVHGGSYICEEIEAESREEAYKLIDSEEYYLLTPAEYNYWF